MLHMMSTRIGRLMQRWARSIAFMVNRRSQTPKNMFQRPLRWSGVTEDPVGQGVIWDEAREGLPGCGNVLYVDLGVAAPQVRAMKKIHVLCLKVSSPNCLHPLC